MPKTFVKGDQEVLVFSPTQEVNLRAQGFQEKAEEPDPVVVAEEGPEAVTPLAPEVVPDKPAASE